MDASPGKSPLHPPPSRAAEARFYQIGGWTRAIQFLLVIGVGLSIVILAMTVGVLEDAHHINGPNVAGLKQKAAIMPILALGQLLACGIAGLALLAWIYNAYANLAALDANPTRFSPPIAVLLCLIPVVNVVMLFFLLSEIWRESDPSRLDPAGHNRSTGGIVSLWFVVTLLGMAGGVYAFVSNSQASQPPDLLDAALLSIGLNALAIVQSVLLTCILGAIYANQVVRRSIALHPPKPVAVTRVPEFPGERGALEGPTETTG